MVAVMGLTEPEFLTLDVAKDIASCIESIIKDESKPGRILAIEVFGLGFKTWFLNPLINIREPYINSQAVIRLLTNLTGLGTVKGNNSAKAPLMIASRKALQTVSSQNAPLVISTLILDIQHSKSLSDRTACLKLLGHLVVKVNIYLRLKPAALFSLVPAMIDAMVKVLDPNQPTVRESLQDIVTKNIAEIVSKFPCVSVHPQSQRLACASMESYVVIYDLRTATKIHTLNVMK